MSSLELIDVSSAASKIVEAGTLFAFMLLVIAGLVSFIMFLMKELRDTRKESTTALVANTAIIAELKEIVRAALHSKG